MEKLWYELKKCLFQCIVLKLSHLVKRFTHQNTKYMLKLDFYVTFPSLVQNILFNLFSRNLTLIPKIVFICIKLKKSQLFCSDFLTIYKLNEIIL